MGHESRIERNSLINIDGTQPTRNLVSENVDKKQGQSQEQRN